MEDKKPKKKTKKQAIEDLIKYYDLELKRNYIKALSQGYKLALNEILELSQVENFNLEEYCKEQLRLRGKMEEGLDRIYDKKGEGLKSEEEM